MGQLKIRVGGVDYIVGRGQKGEKGDPGPAGVGTPGAAGKNGWTPLLAVVADGARRVMQITDWSGGTGTKPTTTGYLGTTGVVPGIGDASDIRGTQGVQGNAGSGINAESIRGVAVSATAPVSGQALVFDGTQYAPGTVAASGSGNSALSIDVSSAASPLALTAAQAAANTLIFTGARTAPLSVLPGAGGSWTMHNKCGQPISVLPAAGSSTKVVVATKLPALVYSDNNGKLFSIPFIDADAWLTQNLILLYDFTDAVGSTIADRSGNGNAGTITGGTWATDGTDSVLDLSAASGYINVPNSATLTTLLSSGGAGTLAMWLKPTTGWATASGSTLIGLVDSNPGSSGAMQIFTQNGKIIHSRGGSGEVTSSAYPSPWGGAWQHIVATWTGATLKLYINGAPVSSGTGGSISGTTLQIGRRNSGTGGQGKRLRQFRAFSRELTATEVSSLYSNPKIGV